MVLRSVETPVGFLLAPILVVLVLLTSILQTAPAWAYDSKAYDTAVGMFKKRQFRPAVDLVDKSYDFRKPDVPIQVPQLSVLLHNHLQDWKKSEEIVDQTLRARLAWWPPADASAPEVTEKIKSEPKATLQFMLTGAEARVLRFEKSYEVLSPADRDKMKVDLKMYFDVLSATDFQPERVQKMWAKVQDHEERVVKEQYRFGANLSLSYWTWEDRALLSDTLGNAQGSHDAAFTPCLGGFLSYTNSFYEFVGGGCIGMGKAGVRFDDATYDNAGKITLLEGYGGGMIIVSDAGSAIGVEGHAMDRSFTAVNSTLKTVKSEDQGFALMAVGRFRMWKFDLKFKGGAMISNPSGIWAVDLSLPVY